MGRLSKLKFPKDISYYYKEVNWTTQPLQLDLFLSLVT